MVPPSHLEPTTYTGTDYNSKILWKKKNECYVLII